MRAVFAFAAKEIPFEKCIVDMHSKAQWHLDFNGGLVPILEKQDGTLIKESDVIANLASEWAPAG